MRIVEYPKLYRSHVYLIIKVWCWNFITKFGRGIAKLSWGLTRSLPRPDCTTRSPKDRKETSTAAGWNCSAFGNP